MEMTSTSHRTFTWLPLKPDSVSRLESALSSNALRIGKSILKKCLAMSILCATVIGHNAFAQNPGNCVGNVPTFTIDLTGQPAGTYTTSAVSREGNCCGTTSPDRCVRFIVTLDPLSVGVAFSITSGAIPPGSLFWQASCGPQTPATEIICLTGVGPHVLTFCKPGNNVNTYSITAVASPIFPPDDTVRVGCSKPLTTLGMKPSTINWTSIFPGTQGAYNSLLSCSTGCAAPLFTPLPGSPAFIDYQVCGFPQADKCGLVLEVCDTVRVYTAQALTGSVTPNPASYCSTSPGVTLTGSASGGVGPYSFTWKNPSGTTIGTGTTVFATTPGTYKLEIRDKLSPACSTTVINIPVSVANIALATTKINVTCNGAANGSATVNVTGGAAPYSFNWTSGATTQTATGLAAGVHTVTVTDQNGCTANTSVTITQPPPLNLNVSSPVQGGGGTNISCNGQSSGSATANITGGVPAYSFLWSNGGTTQTISNLSAGTYTVTVTDQNNCIKIDSIMLSEPAVIVLLIDTVFFNSGSTVQCHGSTNGSVCAVVQGGTAPYNYLWSTGATTSCISGQPAGPVSISVSDANSCTKGPVNFIFIQPTPYFTSISSPVNAGGYNISCNGASDGSINVSVSGSSPPYTFLWSPGGQTTQNLSGVTAGNYTVQITDTNGCVTNESITLTEPNLLQLTLTSPTNSGGTNISCNGQTNGSLTVTLSGGAAPFSYAWSNGGTTQTISNLGAGTYSVTVTDANGCVQSDSYTLTQPGILVPLISSVTISGGFNITCHGNTDGTANVSVTGGTMPYSYAWSNGSTTNSATNLGAGTITVTVTDANGCTADDSFTLTQPDPLITSVTATQYSGGYNVSCFGELDGAAMVNQSGGSGPYTYSWSTGGTAQTITGIGAGSYTVTITDANNCVAYDGITLTEPNLLVATLTPFVQSSGHNVSCFSASDGSINLGINGGSGPFSYNWSNGATTQNISGLTAGTYIVTVTDDNGCEDIRSIVLTQPIQLIVTGISSPVYAGGWNVSCNGGIDGAVNITVGGGSPGYTYLWSNGDTTQNITGLSVTTYIVTVTDVNGCVAMDSITLTEPQQLNLLPIQTQNVDCNGNNTGSVTVSPTGGTPPYSFSLNGGPFLTSGNITGLAAGNYTVTVKDDNACIDSVSFSISQPASLTASSSVTTIGCNAGTATVTVTASGGTSPYTGTGTFTVLAGPYSFTVTDDNGCTSTTSGNISQPAALAASSSATTIGCNGGTATVTVTATGGTSPYTGTGTFTVTAGPYSFTVTDDNGCTSTTAGNITQPTALAAFSSATAIGCNGGTASVTVSATGGTAPYTGTGTFTVSAGPYSFTVTEDNGCISTTSGNISQPAALAASSFATTIGCNGGSATVTVTVTGGTPPYTGTGTFTVTAGAYSFTVTDDNGCTSVTSGNIAQPAILVASSSAGTINCNGGSTTIVVSATGGTTPYTGTGSFTVTAGPFSFTVTDDNGCVSTVTGAVSQPATLVASATAGTISCNGGTTTVTVTATGGTAPYTGTGTFTVTAGPFSFTVTDDNGCTSIASGTAGQPSSLAASSTAGTISCNGGTTTVTVTATGGTMPYTGTGTFSVTAGAYSFTVTDDNGCTSVTSGNIAQPATLVASSSAGTIDCNGGNTTIIVSATGGTTPYTGTGSFIVTAGSFSFTVTDDNGCSSTVSGIVTEPTSLVASSSSGVISCDGGTTTVTVTATGGTTPYTGTGTFTVPAGTYSFTVTDSNGCSSITSGNISQPVSLVASSLSGIIGCNGGSTTVTVSATGGTAPYSGTGTFTVTAGAYSFTVTDDNGCTSTTTGNVAQPSILVASSSAGTIGCNGGTTSVVVSATGGTTPYTGTGTFIVTAGPYSFTVIDDNGCSSTISGTVTEPALLVVTASAGIISCNGGTATVIVTAAGGTTPYTGTGTFTVTAGPYSFTVTDDNGCTSTVTGNMSQPPALTAFATTGTIDCNGGTTTIVVTASGGTGMLEYSINGGPFQTGNTFSGVPAGTHNITVRDANGCVVTIQVTLLDPPLLTVTAAVTSNYNGSQVTCPGAQDGQITVTGGGGSGTYTYSINGGPGQASNIFSGLGAGLYTLQVTDTNGCFNTTTILISNPPALVVSLSATPIECFDGSNGTITVISSGGTGNHMYSLNGGAFQVSNAFTLLQAGMYVITTRDTNNCTRNDTIILSQPPVIGISFAPSVFNGNNVRCNGGTSAFIITTVTGGTPAYTYSWSNGATSLNLAGIGAGIYALTVTDSKGCIMINSVTITEPPPITITSTTDTVKCNGGSNGSVSVVVSGGTPGYTYLWSPGGQTTQNIIGLVAGTYTVTVTDTNSCVMAHTVVVTQPLGMNISAVPTAVTCFGMSDGALATTVTGGTAGFTFLWSSGQTTANITGLTAGTYTVTVTDANNCTSTASFTVTQPPQLIASAGPDQNLCDNQNVKMGATPPGAGVTGLWNILSGTGTISNPSNPTSNVTGTVPGTLTLQWTLTQGPCIARDTVVIKIDQRVTANVMGDTAICSKTGSGKLTATNPNPGSGVWTLVSGTGTIVNPNNPGTVVNGLTVGANVFNWTVTNGQCNANKDVTITLKTEKECEDTLIMPTGITPNSDGYNDYFVIKGLERFPVNTLVVFNRWGNEVYSIENYLNNWQGTNKSGDPLPDGTYFVILKLVKPDRTLTGYLDIRRNPTK
jgi:large repetitive protein